MKTPTWRTKLELIAADGHTVVGHVRAWHGHPENPLKRTKWAAELMVGRTKGHAPVIFDGRRYAIEYVKERYRQHLDGA